MNDTQFPEEIILITGGTGFMGGHLVERLLQEEHVAAQQIHVTSGSGRPGLLSELLPAENIHTVDLTDLAATAAVWQQVKPTQIYHLAAFSDVAGSFTNGGKTISNNVQLQISVLEAARQFSPNAKLVVIGSAQEYDLSIQPPQHGQKIDEKWPLGPANPYAASKVCQDMISVAYLHSFQLNIVRVRPFNHTGERQTPDFVLPSMAKQIVAIERGEQASLAVGNLDSVRDFTDVKDMAAAYTVLMAKGQVGEVYNVGSGQGIVMREALDLLIEQATTPIEVVIDPARFRPSDVPYLVADTTKIQELGWEPRLTFSSTAQRLLTYWRQVESSQIK
jgi:GDP-4-dehydro-6-deoxy-D-mannose reductase